MEELISVIVPIYRVEPYIDQCINSIIKQTYKKLEIILVDDGSDDACPQICDEYAKKDKRIIVIHKENGGADSARKAGISVAAGKYIGYVDGDDWIEEEMYERLMYFAQEFGSEMVESGVIDTWEHTEKRRIPFFEEGSYEGERFSQIIGGKSIYSGSFFSHGISPYLMNKLFLKSRVLKYQMMPELSNNLVDDVMCTFPCLIESRSVYVTHECYYHYRVRGESAKRRERKDIVSTIGNCYFNWINRFKRAKDTDKTEEQIQFFILYLLIAKAVYIFDKQDSEYFLTPFGGIKKGDKIVLYGAGTVGIHLERYIKSVSDDSLIYWADRNYGQLGKTFPVCDPQGIFKLDYDYVIIAILNAAAAESAKESLLRLGVPETKILWIKQEFIDNPRELLKRVYPDKIA